MTETPAKAEMRYPEQITFRAYRPEDFQRCVEITASGWPALMRSIHIASVDWYLGSASWKEVASISDRAVGVLFGKIAKDLTTLSKLSSSVAHTGVYLKMLLGRYGRLSDRLTYLRTAISDDKKIEAYSPDFDGEITFFAVDAAYRGKGIGRQLMGRFVKNAREKGARNIFVYTTNPGSDWTFYERYGFKKRSSYRDEFMSFAMKEEVTAIIYGLDLQNQSAQGTDLVDGA